MTRAFATGLFLALALGVASVHCQDNVTPPDAWAPWNTPVTLNTPGDRNTCGSPGKLAAVFTGNKICFNAPAHYQINSNCVNNPVSAQSWFATEYLILRKWTLGGRTELFATLLLVPVTPYDSTVYLYGLESNTVWTATTTETGFGDDTVLINAARVDAPSTKRAVAHSIIQAVQLLAYGPADACRRDAKQFYPELQGLAAALKAATQQFTP